MGYTLTVADLIIILIIAAVAVMMALSWPVKGSILSLDIRERCFVMGVNITRIGWDHKKDEHSMILDLGRTFDIPPRTGDLITVVETSGDRFRCRIIDVGSVVKIGADRTQAHVVVKSVA